MTQKGMEEKIIPPAKWGTRFVEMNGGTGARETLLTVRKLHNKQAGKLAKISGTDTL